MPVELKPSATTPSTSSQTFAPFPNFDPRLAVLDGAQQTDAAIQNWWGQVTVQLLQLQNTNQQGIQNALATSSSATGTLQAEIDNEATVRADADTALADTITSVTASLTTSINSVAASVVAEASARATADGFLSANYSLTVTAGNVVTGMKINSSTGSGSPISSVIFQAGIFQIYDGSSTAYPVFSVSAGVVKLASTLTVNTSGKVFIGTGSYNDAATQFYVDSSGNFSLGNKLTWNGTTLSITGSLTATTGTIGGWTINSTTISANNAILDSAGQLILGLANNIIYLSSTDVTYRLWVGNVTAASAAFSVTKAGALFSNSGTIGGFTITSTSLTVGSGAQLVTLNTSPAQIVVGDTGTAIGVSITHSTIFIGEPLVTGGVTTGVGGLNGGYIELDPASGSEYIRLDSQSPGQSLFISGTLANPGISFSIDQDTGIYRSGANEYRLVTGGTAQAIIRSTGSNVEVTGTLLVDTLFKADSASDQAHYVICGPNVGSAQSNYALSVIHRNNNTSKYGLFVGTNWFAVENKALTVGNVDATTGAVTEFFNIYGNGQAGHSSGSGAAPGISFISDLASGFTLSGASDFSAYVGGVRYQAWHSSKIVMFQPLQLSGAYTNTPLTSAGSIDILDNGGNVRHVMIGT